MAINFNANLQLGNAVKEGLAQATSNSSKLTQFLANTTYDNFLVHSSKEWLSTVQAVGSTTVKEAKSTADKLKGDAKELSAVAKAAPNSDVFQGLADSVGTGLQDLMRSSIDIITAQDFTGSINTITSAAVTTISGAIVNVSDVGMINTGPSITNNSNVVVNKTSTSISIADTNYRTNDTEITVTKQKILSAENKHTVATNTISEVSTSSRTTAVTDYQVVSSDVNHYSNNAINVASNSMLLGSKGTTSVLAQQDIVIAAGQSSLVEGTSQAVGDINSQVTPAIGKLLLQSTGSVTTQADGTIAHISDSYGANSNKIGFASIDFASNAVNTTIVSKGQSALIGDSITYTGNRTVGISVNPFGILAGTGVAPLVPLLTELLPPIKINVPSLPEFPFGSLADFLSKCLPNVSAVDTINQVVDTIRQSDTSAKTEVQKQDEHALEAQDRLLISLEDPLVPVPKDLNTDMPISASNSIPTASKGPNKPTPKTSIKPQPVPRAVDKIPSNNKEHTFTAANAVEGAAQLGLLHKVYIDRPEDFYTNKSKPTVSNEVVPSIEAKNNLQSSIKSLSSLQRFEVINFFSKPYRKNIDANYSDFITALALVDISNVDVTINNSAQVNTFLANAALVKEMRTFLNTKRPTGIGAVLNSIPYTVFPAPKTPPTIGQGIIDVSTQIALQAQNPMVAGHTTENWLQGTDVNVNEHSFTFGDEFGAADQVNINGFTQLLNKHIDGIITAYFPDATVERVLSLTRGIIEGNIKDVGDYANRIAQIVGGDASMYVDYASQVYSVYTDVVKNSNYSSLLSLPYVSELLGPTVTPIAKKVLSLIGKKVQDRDIYDIAGSIFTALTGIGIPLLDELAKLLGCIDSIKSSAPSLQNISNPVLQDIIDYLPRVIQTVPNKNVLNITPDNCGIISELNADEASINIEEIGPQYVTFRLANPDLIKNNYKPTPDTNTPVNIYCELFLDRNTNQVLSPYKLYSQFTSNVLEYRVVVRQDDGLYIARINNPNTVLVLETVATGALYQYTALDLGNRLVPYPLDAYVLL